MAKKRLQKKKAAAAAARAEQKCPVSSTTVTKHIETKKIEPLKVETKKTEPIKVETKKVEPIKVETKKAEPVKISALSEEEAAFQSRLAHYSSELNQLYHELDHDSASTESQLEALLSETKNFYYKHISDQNISDIFCKKDSADYRSRTHAGVLINVKAFSKTLNNMIEKLDYIQECNVDHLYLTALFSCTESTEQSEYLPKKELGSREDLKQLIQECHKRGLLVAADFMINHSSSSPDGVNKMIFRLFQLADQGIDMVYLKPEQNSVISHSVLRIMRIMCDIVCPGFLLIGKTASNSAAYLGTEEKPECHLLYNDTTMANIWHTVATRDVSLLRRQLDTVAQTADGHLFLNSLRDPSPLSWELDYDYLAECGIQEEPHKKYLNDFLSGNFYDSFARGEVYHAGSTSNNASLCGTTASLCGIERFGFEGNEEGVCRGIRYDITLHAFLLSIPGIPVLYSGDEIGQLNDYSYKDDYFKADDCRNLHKGDFRWELTENRHRQETVQGKLFPALDHLAKIRKENTIFNNDGSFRTLDTWDSSILALVREDNEAKFIGLYNFSEHDKVAWINEEDGIYHDLISGKEMEAKGVQIPAFGCFWLLRNK